MVAGWPTTTTMGGNTQTLQKKGRGVLGLARLCLSLLSRVVPPLKGCPRYSFDETVRKRLKEKHNHRRVSGAEKNVHPPLFSMLVTELRILPPHWVSGGWPDCKPKKNQNLFLYTTTLLAIAAAVPTTLHALVVLVSLSLYSQQQQR